MSFMIMSIDLLENGQPSSALRPALPKRAERASDRVEPEGEAAADAQLPLFERWTKIRGPHGPPRALEPHATQLRRPAHDLHRLVDAWRRLEEHLEA